MRRPLLSKCLRLLLVNLLLFGFSSGCSPDKTGKITFLGRPELKNTSYIYAMNLDGSNQVKLAPVTPFNAEPYQMWSADGKTLAFIDWESETGKTWLCAIDADEKNKHNVLDITCLKVGNFSISPDGKAIVFSRDVSRITSTPQYGTVRVEVTDDSDLFMVDITTGAVKQLTDTPGVWEQYPSFSPDGMQIAFVVRIDTETEQNVPRYIYIMDTNGSNRRELAYVTEDLGFMAFEGFHWSPDSRKITYSLNNFSISDYEHFYDIFMTDVAKGGYTNLTNSLYTIEGDPDWSPDSKKIAYYSGSLNDGFFTWVMDANGKNKTRLYQTGSSASWTPDGKGLIFTNRLNVYEILEMDAKGGNLRTLLKSQDLSFSNPVWLTK